MLQDPSTRVIACDVDRRPKLAPNLRAIDADKAVHVRIYGKCIQVSELHNLFARFGPVRNVVPTSNPASKSNIIIFSLEESASRAKQY